MPLRLIEVKTDEQFEKMIPGFWAAFNNPRSVALELNFPVKGDGPCAVAEAIEECKKRFLDEWHANPVARYIQIIDKESDDAVVASANWNFYDDKHNDFKDESNGNSEDDKITWWLKGSEAWKYNTMAAEQRLIVKRQRQNKPHVYLGICYTNPAYRRRGAARMLMDWGVKKADELGLECFLDAAVNAVPFYKNFGFVMVDVVPYNMKIDNPSEEWRELEKKFPLAPQINMWRPVGGKFKEGEKYPWEN